VRSDLRLCAEPPPGACHPRLLRKLERIHWPQPPVKVTGAGEVYDEYLVDWGFGWGSLWLKRQAAEQKWAHSMPSSLTDLSALASPR
jgi:hypothetical protein